MKRRIKIAFFVQDLDLPSGNQLVIRTQQTIVEFDDVGLGQVLPSQATEELDAAGVIIARYIRENLPRAKG